MLCTDFVYVQDPPEVDRNCTAGRSSTILSTHLIYIYRQMFRVCKCRILTKYHLILSVYSA